MLPSHADLSAKSQCLRQDRGLRATTPARAVQQRVLRSRSTRRLDPHDGVRACAPGDSEAGSSRSRGRALRRSRSRGPQAGSPRISGNENGMNEYRTAWSVIPGARSRGQRARDCPCQSPTCPQRHNQQSAGLTRLTAVAPLAVSRAGVGPAAPLARLLARQRRRRRGDAATGG